MKKRIMTLLLALVLVFSLLPTMALAATADPPAEAVPADGEWISKSKEATNLNTDFTSDVTLSMPSAQTELVSDVVFVLDKSTSAELEQGALDLLEALRKQIVKTDAKVNVGVVIFNKVANVTPFMDLTTQYDEIEAAIKQTISSGTNTHAGLLAGKKMLDDDTTTDASRKYLIFVSDGVTYQFCKDDDYTKAYTRSYDGKLSENVNQCGTLSELSVQYTDAVATKGIPCNSIDAWMTSIANRINTAENGNPDWDYEYTGQAPEDSSKLMQSKDNVSNVEKALYLTKSVYESLQKENYHCYSVLAKNTYPFGTAFMNMLSKGEPLSFKSITNDILYAVDKGSTLVDTMGYAAGDYDFDFVDEIGTLALTVGDVEYPVQKQDTPDSGDTTTYTFGKEKTADDVYPFVLHYVKAAADGEHFKLDINQPINNFERVQLTYRVKLTNPKTEAGTYGVYDRCGENHENALFTNNSAILYPVGTGGVAGDPQEFLKPTVSYTIDEQGEIVPDALFGIWLNVKDHYSYLIGYTDGTVRPNGKITRAEVATIFFRLLTDDTRAKYWSSENSFSDVSADKWYNNAVSTLCHMGVLGGYSDGTFRPNAPITRAEFAKIAVSFSQKNGSAVYNYFTDVKTTDWFAPAVTAAKDNGLIEGYSDGTFKPENKITRAEACAIVNRVLGRKPSKSHMKISDRIDWPDCTTADWFYEAIMEATNSHTYQMGKRVETWNDKLPQRDWAALETGWASAYTGKGGEVR